MPIVTTNFSCVANTNAGTGSQDFTARLQANQTSITTALATSATIKVAATVEETVSFPGLAKLRTIQIVSTQPVDVSIAEDLSLEPVYTNIYSTVYARAFNTSTVFSHIKIKASTLDAIVQVFVAGDLAA